MTDADKPKEQQNSPSDNQDSELEQTSKPASIPVEETPEYLKLKARIAELEGDLLLHAADIQNLQKNHFIELQSQLAKTRQRVLISLIQEIVDTFTLAMNPDLEHHTFRAGMEMVYKSFMDFLQKQDVEIINPVAGTPLNHAEHNITSVHHSSEHQSNTVYKVFQPGYKIGNNILRPANVMVVVNEKS